MNEDRLPVVVVPVHGTPTATGRPGFPIIVAGFLAGYANPRTREAYAHDISEWARWCARAFLDPFDVQRAHVDLWVRHMEQHLAPATVSRRLTAVRSLYQYMTDEDHILKDPTRRVKPPKIPETPQHSFGFADAIRLLEVAVDMGPKFEAFSCVLWFASLRISEVGALRIDRLSERRGMLQAEVLCKGGMTRPIAFNPRTAYALRKYIGARTEGPVFIRQDGLPLDRRTGWAWAVRIGAKVGVHSPPHAWRRSSLTVGCEFGKIEDAQHHAGHKDMRTTQRYNQRRFDAPKATALLLESLIDV